MALFSGKQNAKPTRLEKFHLGNALEILSKVGIAIGFLFFVVNYFRVILLFTYNMSIFVDAWVRVRKLVERRRHGWNNQLKNAGV